MRDSARLTEAVSPRALDYGHRCEVGRTCRSGEADTASVPVQPRRRSANGGGDPFMLLSAAARSASSDGVSLQGTVVQAPRSAPIAGASVSVGDTHTTTDSRGGFVLRGLSAGRSVLTICTTSAALCRSTRIAGARSDRAEALDSEGRVARERVGIKGSL